MHKSKPSRRHVIAGAAVLAPASVTGAIAATGANDAELGRLFAGWEPLEREYRAAADAEDKADSAYATAIYRAPKRAHDGLKAMAQRQAIYESLEKIMKEERFKSAGFKPLTAEKEAELIIDNLKPYMEDGETPEQFIEFCRDEVSREMQSKEDAKARYRVDDLREAVQDVVQRERELSERMAAIPADTMAGVGLKLQVAQSLSAQKLSVSIMEDVRRLAGLPSGVDEYGGDAFLMNVA